MRSVTVNGGKWARFDPGKETIELTGLTGKVTVAASYGKPAVGLRLRSPWHRTGSQEEGLTPVAAPQQAKQRRNP